jgi:hypothetical protein
MARRLFAMSWLIGVMTFCGCTAANKESYRLSTRSQGRVSRSSDVRVPPRHRNEFNPRRESQDQFEDRGPGVPPEATDLPVNDPAPETRPERVKSVGFRRHKAPECGSIDETCSDDRCSTIGENGSQQYHKCLTEHCGDECESACASEGCSGESGWKFPNLVPGKMKCLFRRDSCTGPCDEDDCSECLEPLITAETVEKHEYHGSCSSDEHASCGEGLVYPDGCGDYFGGYSPAVRGRKPCLAEPLRDPFLDQECQHPEGVHAPEGAIENHDAAEHLDGGNTQDFGEIQPLQIEGEAVPVINSEPETLEIQPADTVIPAAPQSSSGIVEPPVWRGPKSQQIVKPKVRTISNSAAATQYQHSDGSELKIIPGGASSN